MQVANAATANLLGRTIQIKPHDDEATCSERGAVHLVHVERHPEFDNGEVRCLVCWNLLSGWSGPGRKTVTLKEPGASRGPTSNQDTAGNCVRAVLHQRMPNTAHAFFSLTCRREQEVAEVSLALGMEPSRVVVTSMSDPASPSGTAELHLWHLLSPLPEIAGPNAHVERLAEILSPRAEAVCALTDRLDGSVHCHVEYRRPPFPAELCVWKPTVRALAKMGLSVTFDVFFLPEPGWDKDAPIECY